MAKKQKKIKLYPIWTTRDGRVIPINQMDDKHLVNTINYLEKRVLDIKVKVNDEPGTREYVTAVTEADGSVFFPILIQLRKLADERKLVWQVAEVPICRTWTP